MKTVGAGFKIQIKRVYEAKDETDGQRFLIDGLWPRGVLKEALRGTAWLKEAAPSTELRQWFKHDPAKWDEFQKRYRAELDAKPETWMPLLEAAGNANLTLLFSARDFEHNNAVVLKTYLDERLKAGDRQ
jgi:uncharacterized protein YeaO (DUF488 family)